ncbi:MAG: DNA gyrase subunit A [Cytophagales bacterium]|nr:DNA gyrase subunit A [Bernardetiaceae bacterium]MDW8210944.1 DNA gyrase subunit A [Cytophagales bacterium]
MQEGVIIPINIEDEMRSAYIDYSMSVIVSRALPDVRDGLKPVHRRILYAMNELGLTHNKPYKKSARIVGEVLGKYHPHGDSAVYDAMVRMAQPWSLRYPLVDGQGNFGSMDGDNPAAMRYTEARLQRLAEEMLADINKNTIDFQPNFDDSTQEPAVLPAKLPNLLVNGSSGIAVGMATNMAPHNLAEVADGIIAYIDNPHLSLSELMQYIKAPDFPTGGVIYGYQGVREAYATGKGKVIVRGVAKIEELPSGRQQIVVTQLPYQVNKAQMIEKTAALVNEKKIEGITAIRDESDREGVRIVYELKKEANAQVVLNNLYAQTQLQISFSINNVALVKGRPMTLTLKDLIRHYVEHRHEVIIRRTRFDLEAAEKRTHILEGLLKALDIIDQVISHIRTSADAAAAKQGLVEQFGFTPEQAQAILEMRLQRLTGLEREKLQAEYADLVNTIQQLRNILAHEPLRMKIIQDELRQLKEQYGDARRTEIVYHADDIALEDMIPDEEMVITISHQGYIKRTPLSEYRTQGRGGVGSRGAATKEDDFTEQLFIANMHSYILLFTNRGKIYWLRVYEIPEGSKTSKGRPIQNLIQIEPNEKVQTALKVRTLSDPDYINNNYIVMCTEQGIIKKTPLEAFARPRAAGIHAITINEGDNLLNARLTSGNDDIVIATRSGKAVRFNESRVRPMGRTAAGVTGITFEEENDKVIGMIAISRPDSQILVVSEKGYGKRSPVEDYRLTNRGAKGVKTINITEKTGALVSILEVADSDQLMIINKSGLTIRISVDQLPVMGRATQGVRLIRLNEEDEISSVAKIERLVEELNNNTTPASYVTSTIYPDSE